MTILKKRTSKIQTSSEVVDGYLILSLPNAIDPLVWRMSLEKIGTASFEVKKNKDDEKAKLILKPKKGTAEIIASFDTQQEAVDALIAASNSLQNGGQKNTVATNTSPIKPNNKIQKTANKAETNQWLLALLCAFLVIGLYYYLTTLIPETLETTNNQNTQVEGTRSTSSTAGKPISADDFLSEF